MDISAEQSLTRFHDIKAARTIENGLYLVVLLLWVIHSLTLYRALRRTSPTPALFGTALSIVGLVVLVAGALPHVATAPISDLYHAPGATLQDQAALVVLWHGIEAMFDALLVTGFVILPVSLVTLGTAMLRAPALSKSLGRMSVAFGLVGIVAAAIQLADPASDVGALVMVTLIVFHLTLGWKTHKLARATHPRTLAGAR